MARHNLTRILKPYNELLRNIRQMMLIIIATDINEVLTKGEPSWVSDEQMENNVWV